MWTRRRFVQAALTAALGAFIPAVGGCSARPSLGAISEALQALRSQRIAPPPLEGYREFRGVVHAHTALSHDSTGTVEEILEAASFAKLDFLITTDHYTPRIFTEGLDGRNGQWDVDALFKVIRSQGALAIIAHPRGLMNRSYFRYADGLEICDLADTVRDRLVDVPRFLLAFLMDYGGYSQDEILVPLIVERSNWNLVEWDRFTKVRRYIGLAGNDAHQNLNVFGRQADPYLLTFRAVNTHIVAPLGVAESFRPVAPPLTTDDLMSALRAGRCFVSFNLMADAAGFRFAARVREGGPVVALMGDEVPLQDGLVLAAQCPVPGSVELLRDGVPIRRQEGRELLHPVDRPGVYRIEVSLRVVDRWLPWIFSNPIYVRA
ncbi:MAG: hypothetical protein AUH95_00830 [Nitrospirae bacterium 13_2_20CM_2_63_8]|nr:MAG: hypothetical protein AUH95_00830 [Nitrospirae bacterium 13_2_20CM_2_63_8]